MKIKMHTVTVFALMTALSQPAMAQDVLNRASGILGTLIGIGNALSNRANQEKTTQESVPVGNNAQLISATPSAQTAANSFNLPGANMAIMSPAQAEMVDTKISITQKNSTLQALIQDAKSAIKEVLSIRSCMISGTEFLGRFVAPGSIAAQFMADPFLPLQRVDKRFHNDGSCMNIDSIYAWSSPSPNALSFSVKYVSAITGQSNEESHLIIKQPDGRWLFDR